ncbi:pseudouridine synthase [Maribellus comscasis]|uniref:Pseudouridine synthase n=2 Tax=Maribellus comscasis TaxID=2681766 RepID=A0A6I6JXK6_9BACT|nr:pseudouridine synthase [Maribellus comscasis]
MRNFSDLCRNQTLIMRNNYKKGDSKRVGGGKRIGKSLENKETKSLKKGVASKGRFSKSETEKSKRYSSVEEKKTYSKTKARVIKKTPKKQTYSEDIRLNRFIANAGVCSRREADTYISAGLVSINGKTVTELGTKVKPGDEVRFDGRRLSAEKKVYLLLNKPKDFVTTTDDPHADKTVMDLVRNACEERVYPVGRLDRNTTGLLLFTNDGDLSKKLTHPSHNMKKVYQVTLNKALTKEHLLQIADGLDLEDGRIAADAISFITPENRTEIGIEIHSGRNRIVRRIFEHLGYRVKKLDRVLFAGLTKKNLPRGKWRFLSEKEIHFLKIN